jgi:type-F conjugative transfer system pilin assembly protein TrbC
MRKSYLLFIILAFPAVFISGAYATAEELLSEDTWPKYNVNEIFAKKELSTNLYIFATLSLKDNNFKELIEAAKLYKATIVLRGLKNNSFSDTSKHIQKIGGEGEEASIIIDPILFKEYSINQVPTYVLAKEKDCLPGTSCPNLFDKLAGNVSPKYALEKFADKGDLSTEAVSLLGTAR